MWGPEGRQRGSSGHGGLRCKGQRRLGRQRSNRCGGKGYGTVPYPQKTVTHPTATACVTPRLQGPELGHQGSMQARRVAVHHDGTGG